MTQPKRQYDMNDDDRKKMIRHLTDKWGEQRKCPMCGKGPWGVDGEIFELRKFNKEAFVVGGPIVPVVPVTCNNCGNTILVNAFVAGVLEPQTEGDGEANT